MTIGTCTRSLRQSYAIFRPSHVIFASFSTINNPGHQQQPPNTIRLSKRMSELDICSRREADRLIMDGRIFIDGNLVAIGKKVPFDLGKDRVEIRQPKQSDREDDATSQISTVVLNKPVDYVSGQAEHGHPPAIRLLTPSNLFQNDGAPPLTIPASWDGFAPAGRLDMDSTGLLVFTKSGVVAKKIIGSSSSIEKEYIVHVSPAMQPSRRELAIDPDFRLPTSTFNLKPLLKGGGTLLGDEKSGRMSLKPCAKAEWIIRGEKLRIVLTEGRKHHIRRVCRELLGWHVNYLQRVRIGPIHLDGLSEGNWRPLVQEELDILMSA
jgi:23S rRNA pseudouridine2604 synthase